MCSCVLERARAHSSERCGNSKKASAAVGMLVRLVDITRVSHRRSPRRLPAPTSIHRYLSVSAFCYFPVDPLRFAFRARSRSRCAGPHVASRHAHDRCTVLGGIFVLYSCKPPSGLR